MAAYYNEIDPHAAQWLRNLITGGHIAPGDVDERSIEDVRADDLRGYSQCHFFAGIGVWSYTLRRAGWPDGQPVWTGSCPCQPFSSAGPQAGFADERHLWPAFFHLIEECRPPVVFGEQVASKAAEPWIDLVQTDLEGVGYSFGCVPFPSAGVGAPHIRDRLFWVGNAHESGLERFGGGYSAEGGRVATVRPVAEASELGGLGDSGSQPRERDPRSVPGAEAEEHSARFEDGRKSDGLESTGASVGWVADAHSGGFETAPESKLYDEKRNTESRGGVGERSGPTNGFWRDADWLFCRDGRWRPVRPGTFPLVDGAPARVVRLRAYGNAINAEAATEFVQAYLEGAIQGPIDLGKFILE